MMMTLRVATGLLCLLSVAAFAPRSLAPKPSALSSCAKNENDTLWNVIAKSLAIGMIAGSTMLGGGPLPTVTPPVASAAESRIIGELKGSGLVFKDTLEIESFEDPKVKGVTLYVSNFQRPLTERLQKDFFSDPSSAAVGCAKTGPVQVADNIVVGKEGEEVFKESKSLLFKSLRVQRIYDKEKNTVVYVSFNTRLDKNDDSNKSRFKSSICAVGLEEVGSNAVASAQAAAAVAAP
ncbi:Protein CreA [Seminavis robusta]|uniref:Protein CreA n=1 Tax=Seminavis robusta TaxID=568900 RepID=A0A9N8HJ31_9STRA|nr:Protein CreA [Seminavis robusta]|eukprot:Sro737_g195140.1 Protein CreA (236) ;mRNA; r:27788-29026